MLPARICRQLGWTPLSNTSVKAQLQTSMIAFLRSGDRAGHSITDSTASLLSKQKKALAQLWDMGVVSMTIMCIWLSIFLSCVHMGGKKMTKCLRCWFTMLQECVPYTILPKDIPSFVTVKSITYDFYLFSSSFFFF